MRKIIKDKMNSFAAYTEMALAFFLTLVIIILVIKMIFGSFFEIGTSTFELEYYLKQAMTLAVGVEFVKMLCTHTPETVIEVLLFAIARQLVIEHLDIVQTLVGVIAIAGLFAIRKFLFTSKDEV